MKVAASLAQLPDDLVRHIASQLSLPRDRLVLLCVSRALHHAMRGGSGAAWHAFGTTNPEELARGYRMLDEDLRVLLCHGADVRGLLRVQRFCTSRTIPGMGHLRLCDVFGSDLQAVAHPNAKLLAKRHGAVAVQLRLIHVGDALALDRTLLRTLFRTPFFVWMLQARYMTLEDAAGADHAMLALLMTPLGWQCFQRDLISWPRLMAMPSRHQRQFCASDVPLRCVGDGLATLEQIAALPSSQLVCALTDGIAEWLRVGVLTMEQLAVMPKATARTLAFGAPFALRCVSERLLMVDDILRMDPSRLVLVGRYPGYYALKSGAIRAAQIAHMDMELLCSIIEATNTTTIK